MLQEHLQHISLSRLSTYLDHFYLGDQAKLSDAVNFDLTLFQSELSWLLKNI